MRISRRTMLAGTAAAVTAPMLATALARREDSRPALRLAAAQTAATVSFSLENNTLSDTVYAFVTGQALDRGGALTLLEADGQTPYYPASPSTAGSPLGPTAPSRSTPPAAPRSRSRSRIWPGRDCGFSIGTPLTFLLNPGPGLVEPSVTNPSDPNIDLQWDFSEFTYNDAQLFANISYVDFAAYRSGSR